MSILGSAERLSDVNRHFHQPIRKVSGPAKGYSSSNRDERTQWKEEFDVSCMRHAGQHSLVRHTNEGKQKLLKGARL